VVCTGATIRWSASDVVKSFSLPLAKKSVEKPVSKSAKSSQSSSKVCSHLSDFRVQSLPCPGATIRCSASGVVKSFSLPSAKKSVKKPVSKSAKSSQSSSKVCSHLSDFRVQSLPCPGATIRWPASNVVKSFSLPSPKKVSQEASQ